MTYAIEETEFLVGQFLVLGDDVFGELEQGVFVAPEQLGDADLNEGLDFKDVHDGGHRQAQEASGVLALRSGALQELHKKEKRN